MRTFLDDCYMVLVALLVASLGIMYYVYWEIIHKVVKIIKTQAGKLNG